MGPCVALLARACHRLPCGPRRAQSDDGFPASASASASSFTSCAVSAGECWARLRRMNGIGDRRDHAAPDHRRAVAADVGDPPEDGLEDHSAAGAHQRVERQHGRALLGRDHVVEVGPVHGVVDRGGDAPHAPRARSATQKLRTSPRPSSTIALETAASRIDEVRCRKSLRTHGASAPPEDRCAREQRGRQTGHRVRLFVAPQLEQVRLQRVEDVDADAGGERAREHEPAHRRVAEPVLHRRAEHGARRLDRVLSALGSEADVVHQQRGDDEHHQRGCGADQERHAEVGRAGRSRRRAPSPPASRCRPRSARGRRRSRGCRW